MDTVSSIADIPNLPAVYALYGGKGKGRYVAYVGVAGSLKARIVQHLVSCDSSIATGTSAVGLNPDHVTEVRWWWHERFADRHALEAAELVAFDVLEPALRSRAAIRGKAHELYGDESFKAEMHHLFDGQVSGRLVVPTLVDALERIAELERRVDALEARVRAKSGVGPE